MRIAWFTPFSEKSAIARFSEWVVSELSRRVDVDLWYPQTNDARTTKLKKVPFSKIGRSELTELSTYDLTVYNLGNYFPFHREIVPLVAQAPGISILHDLVMHHYFAAHYLEELRDPRSYMHLMDRHYGDSGRKAAEDALAGRRRHIWETDDLIRYPLYEEAIRGSYGVVTHSSYQQETVRMRYAGPIAKIPLAYQAALEERHLSREELGVAPEKILIVTIGHVNANKRIHSVIDALAHERALATKLTYAVLGPHEPAYYEQLVALRERHGLADSIVFTGYATERVMHSYLHHADICVNLRFPATEGASGSLIEQLQRGKAVIVTDTASYSALPDDCVWKIHHGREEMELPVALRKLISDQTLRTSLGSRARQYTLQQHQPSRYAEAFLQFASEVRRDRPLLELSDRLAAELNQMGIHAGMETVGAVSRECEDLFGEPKGGPEDEAGTAKLG